MKEEIQMEVVQIAQKILTNPAFLDDSGLLVKELHRLYERALIFHFLEKNLPETLKPNRENSPSQEKISEKPREDKPSSNDWEQIRVQAPEKEIIFEQKTPYKESHQKTLNDSISVKQLQIGLNDRIAFISHLFNGNTDAYNRAIGMLNNLHSPDECWDFILNKVKPSFNNWQGKEEYEDRFFLIISKRFG